MFRIDRNLVNIAKLQEEAAKIAKAEKDASIGAAPVDPRDTPEGKEALRLMEEAQARIEEAEEIRRKAEGLIKDAEKKAGEIITQAEAEAREIKARAQETGFEEGHERGLENGRLEASNELEARLQEERGQFSAFMEKLSQAWDERVDSFEDDIISLVLASVKKMIDVSIEKEDEAFYSLIKKAIRRMKREGSITVRVSQTEYERLFQSESAAFDLGDETVTAAIIVDSELERGGCVIESEGETINAGVDSQLKLLTIAFHAGQED